MTRAIAYDAMRYVSRTYTDERKQYDKMAKRHGSKVWYDAQNAAARIHLSHGDRECMAVLIEMTHRAIGGDDTPIVQ